MNKVLYVTSCWLAGLVVVVLWFLLMPFLGKLYGVYLTWVDEIFK